MTLAPVLKAFRQDRISNSRPGDFRLGARSNIPSLMGMGSAVPYCFDLVRQRSLYALGLNPEELMDAPFYYLRVREKAGAILSIPWEHFVVATPSPPPIIYVFSAGRTGSTLLHTILRRSGMAAISEPDIYTQAASGILRWMPHAYRQNLESAVSIASWHLVSRLLKRQSWLAVKLRAECCRDPALFVPAQSGVRTIFLTRDFEAWARSSLRVFRRTPRMLIKQQLASLRCLEYLKSAGPCHVLRYEDVAAGEPEAFTRLSAFVGWHIPRHAIAAALARNSQENTPLAKQAREPLPDLEKKLQQTLRLWTPHRQDAEALLDRVE